jgi:hypothetical protein
MRGPWLSGQERLLSSVTYCVALAYILLTIFAGLEVIQYRMFYFYLLPVVFVAGGHKLTRFSLLIGVLLSSAYVVKYNVLHKSFLTSARLMGHVEGYGIIHTPDLWVPCGEGCYEFGLGSTIKLEAKSSPGYRFKAWEGCGGSRGICQLDMSTDKTVKAIFIPAFTLSMRPVGEGMVSVIPYPEDAEFYYFNEHGGACPKECQVAVDSGQKITLTATPYAGHRFVKWEGACESAQPSCELLIDNDKSVNAIFESDEQ